MGGISKDTQFAELMNQVRHLGTVRFTMLAVFGALTVGLFALSPAPGQPSPEVLAYSRSVGTALAVVLIILEALLSGQQVALSERASALEGPDGPILKGKPYRQFGPVTIASVGIYVAFLVLWWSI